ncbi:hypothetical protein RND71_015772 [Anisodus tanguticus]|uniref:Uncharacterized protein n=1 Tax=Anisodus tanguticus TaxID=243964 RepID=A0AAE1S7H1_9SOLA|nr:hypothetical protein RND71_015772 [Anisodus tanguticus]
MSADEEAGARKLIISFLSGLRGKEKRFCYEKANGRREGSRLSRALAKLDSHSEALRVSERLVRLGRLEPLRSFSILDRTREDRYCFGEIVLPRGLLTMVS